MSKICQITGKKAMVGNNVSHSKRRTKRTFDVNLFTKKLKSELDDMRRLVDRIPPEILAELKRQQRTVLLLCKGRWP